MALVWNPTTGRVSPQYHVVFNEDFTTVPYMEAGTLPPNWQELIEHSSEIATTKDVFKADTCLSDQQIVDSADQITDLSRACGESIDIKKVSCSMACKVTLWR